MALFTNLFPGQRATSLHTVLRPGVIPKPRGLAPAAYHGRFTCSVVQFNDSIATMLSNQMERRSANYQPTHWDYELLQSRKNEFVGGMYIERASVLKEQVKTMLDEDLKPMSRLELIDDLQRLGIFYHFEDKIQSILERIYNEKRSNIMPNKKGLYETALAFRLLRQNRFPVPKEVFDCFRCDEGDFKASLSEDTKGLLYLYEASFLLTENESTLELAREFAFKHLKKNLEEKTVDEELAELVKHALELPLHWRMLRLEARWFIDVYEKRPRMNPTILELAKLDFNIVQATHLSDLQYASRWWNSTGFAEKLRFSRDRLVESFFCTVGVSFNPQYGYCRRLSTKVNALVTAIDDIYDVYGTLDELEAFTDAVERWDIKAIHQLPDYMKICYFGLFNSINETAYDALKEQGAHIIPHLSKAWADLCRAYLQEAKWYFSGYIPTLEEYLNNGWISISAAVILVHIYFFVSNPIKEESLQCLDRHHNIIRCSGMIVRLANDLGTSPKEMERGDVLKSVQCYMKETGCSDEEARDYIRLLISETWKEMNKERVTETHFSQTFIGMAMNLGRMGQCLYQYGDGYGHQNAITRDRISALLFEPIPLGKT